MNINIKIILNRSNIIINIIIIHIYNLYIIIYITDYYIIMYKLKSK